MSWTTPQDLRAQVQKLWDKGEILANLISGPTLFPKRLLLKSPTSADLSDRFEAARAWSSALRTMPHCRVDMREFRHRVLGVNALPDAVWVDSLEEACALIGKQREVACFRGLIESTRVHPPLLAWLAKRPLRALELVQDWPRLLEVVSWLCAHPRPGIYLRQVDIAGVRSKFIEAHRGVLSELLDCVLPPECVDATASGLNQFAQRYGFCDKPERIRFRILDPRCALLPGAQIHDITLDVASFAGLQCTVSRVFITENEINFLAFPEMPGSMVIFGAGYGFDALAQARWLADCRIYYWGDIDTHGFAILDQLRARFAHVESLLMDRETLLAFESQWGHEDKPTTRDLSRLRADEQALYDDLRDNRIGKALRLEQERIGFGWVLAALAKL